MHIILQLVAIILITAIIIYLIKKLITIYRLNKFRYHISIGQQNSNDPIFFKMQIITRKGRITKSIYALVKVCTPSETNKHKVFVVFQDPTKPWFKNITRTVPINTIYPQWAIKNKKSFTKLSTDGTYTY